MVELLPAPKPQTEILKGPKVESLMGSKNSVTFKVTGEPRANQYGFLVPGKIGKEEYLLPLSPDGRDYRVATEQLGRNAEKWEGRSLRLGIRIPERGKHKGKKFLAVLE